MTSFELVRVARWMLYWSSSAAMLGCSRSSLSGPATPSSKARIVAASDAAPQDSHSKKTLEIEIYPDYAAIALGAQQEFTAQLFSESGAVDVTATGRWSVVGGQSVASIERAGSVRGVVPGVARIEVEFDGVTAYAQILVGGIVLDEILVRASPDSIKVGSTAKMVATGQFDDGLVRDISNVVTWTISESTVLSSAELQRQQIVTGIAVGDSAVEAKFGIVARDVVVTVQTRESGRSPVVSPGVTAFGQCISVSVTAVGSANPAKSTGTVACSEVGYSGFESSNSAVAECWYFNPEVVSGVEGCGDGRQCPRWGLTCMAGYQRKRVAGDINSGCAITQHARTSDAIATMESDLYGPANEEGCWSDDEEWLDGDTLTINCCPQ